MATVPDDLEIFCTAGINAKVAREQRRTSNNDVNFMPVISELVYTVWPVFESPVGHVLMRSLVTLQTSTEYLNNI